MFNLLLLENFLSKREDRKPLRVSLISINAELQNNQLYGHAYRAVVGELLGLRITVQLLIASMMFCNLKVVIGLLILCTI